MKEQPKSIEWAKIIAIVLTAVGLLLNARDSAPVNAQLARALFYKAQMSRRPGLRKTSTLG